MKEEIVFSIITCTYNAAETVGVTLRSVSGQSYDGIEHIIVDGASQDGTLETVRQYGSRVSRIISEPDKGLYDAMNKGIDAASGDYLIFLNAGDTFHGESTLREVAQMIKENGRPEIIYGETAIVNSNGEFVRMRRLTAPDTLNWKSFKSGMRVCHQAFYVRRDKALKYDLKYRYSSDFDWCIRVMRESSQLLNTRMILADYLDEGLTTRNRRKSLKERFRIMSVHYGLAQTVVLHIFFFFRFIVKR